MRSIIQYLESRPRLYNQILNREELKRLARSCGMSPDDARFELKKLGFTLTRNDHGIAVWKKQVD